MLLELIPEALFDCLLRIAALLDSNHHMDLLAGKQLLYPLLFSAVPDDLWLRWGVVSYADSLDCVGVLGADVAVVKRVFGELIHYPKVFS